MTRMKSGSGLIKINKVGEVDPDDLDSFPTVNHPHCHLVHVGQQITTSVSRQCDDNRVKVVMINFQLTARVTLQTSTKHLLSQNSPLL